MLFLCTGNSARSIIAEAILNRDGAPRFKAFSAGSFPAGKVNPYALDLLTRLGFATAGLRSKSWDEFSSTAAPSFDFIFTLCDDAAGEACPVWLGRPVTTHWGVPDPAAAEGGDDDKQIAFDAAFRALSSRIQPFLNLPLESLSGARLRRRLADIGRLQEDLQSEQDDNHVR